MKELLIRLRQYCVTDMGQCVGICDVLYHRTRCQSFTLSEFKKLDIYLDKYLPHKTTSYCWPIYQLEPRLEWLDEQIAKFT